MASRHKPPNVAEAERRIDAILSGKSSEIKLENLGLIELPERLREASAVDRLSLYGNHLENLPTWLKEFQNLTYLNLYANRFHSVPRCVLKLGSLRSLGLGRNLGLDLSKLDR